MIRLNLFMIWFLHFLSLLSVICRYYSQNSSSRIIVVLVYTVSTLFCCSIPYYEYHLSQRREVGWRFVVLKRLYDETTIIGDHGDGFVPSVFGTGSDR